MNFDKFNKAINNQFGLMATAGKLFKAGVPKDLLWDAYLLAFPVGTNPIVKERTEHDCNCCKNFIRNAGNIVAIVNGNIQTIWDIQIDDAYQVVADEMAEIVRSATIDNVLVHSEPVIGTLRNAGPDETGNIKYFYHFAINLPKEYVVKKDQIGPKLSDFQSGKDVFLRGLKEITVDALEIATDLIAQNSVYRLEEHKFLVDSLFSLKKKFDKLKTDEQKDLFAWEHIQQVPPAVARVRNTVVGTFLQDLSEGVDLEKAVKSYESKVAPTNYKRPTTIVTAKMIKQAQETIQELGYTSSLQRRFATLEDITINNVLFADRSVKKALNVFDELIASTPAKKPSLEGLKEIPIETFISTILPKAQSLEVLFENKHVGNLVSLIAPVDPDSKNMFKWDNNFSWDYRGGAADSMRERVSAAGGRVDGALRFTHSWNHPEIGRNESLMDLHVFLPGHVGHKDGKHDIYGDRLKRIGWNQRNHDKTGGRQDVDYTDAAPKGYVPIENISFPLLSRMPEGKYVFKIHNWSLRGTTTSGFKAEIEFGGQIFQYNYPKPLGHKEWVTVAEATLKNGEFTIEHKLDSKASSVKVWNVNTETFVKVNSVMYSPNYWDEKQVGNKHVFLMLEGCKHEGQARGFYNEFLSAELDKHRKVLEVVGAKMKTDESDNQLSGIGISTTQRNHLIIRVEGSFAQTVKVTF